MNRILFLPLILFIIVGMIGCGCCLVGGGDTGRANRLAYAHKKMGVGLGGPGWSMLTRLGARFAQEEEPQLFRKEELKCLMFIKIIQKR